MANTTPTAAELSQAIVNIEAQAIKELRVLTENYVSALEKLTNELGFVPTYQSAARGAVGGLLGLINMQFPNLVNLDNQYNPIVYPTTTTTGAA